MTRFGDALLPQVRGCCYQADRLQPSTAMFTLYKHGQKPRGTGNVLLGTVHAAAKEQGTRSRCGGHVPGSLC